MKTQVTQRSPKPPPDLLTIAATATRLGCSDMHVYRLIAAGELKAVDIAQPGARRAKTRVRSDDLASYIEAKTRRADRSSPPAFNAEADSTTGPSRREPNPAA